MTTRTYLKIKIRAPGKALGIEKAESAVADEHFELFSNTAGGT